MKIYKYYRDGKERKITVKGNISPRRLGRFLNADHLEEYHVEYLESEVVGRYTVRLTKERLVTINGGYRSDEIATQIPLEVMKSNTDIMNLFQNWSTKHGRLGVKTPSKRRMSFFKKLLLRHGFKLNPQVLDVDLLPVVYFEV